MINLIRNEEADMSLEQMWDYLIECGIATRDELVLVTNINGYNEEALESVLYARTGYRSIEQLEECE
jgi:hypothetical protein